MPSGTGIAPPRCHPPPDGGTLRHVNNSLPGPVSEGSVHGNGSRQPDNWLLALAEPFVTVLAHGNGVSDRFRWGSLGIAGSPMDSTSSHRSSQQPAEVCRTLSVSIAYNLRYTYTAVYRFLPVVIEDCYPRSLGTSVFTGFR